MCKLTKNELWFHREFIMNSSLLLHKKIGLELRKALFEAKEKTNVKKYTPADNTFLRKIFRKKMLKNVKEGWRKK